MDVFPKISYLMCNYFEVTSATEVVTTWEIQLKIFVINAHRIPRVSEKKNLQNRDIEPLTSLSCMHCPLRRVYEYTFPSVWFVPLFIQYRVNWNSWVHFPRERRCTGAGNFFQYFHHKVDNLLRQRECPLGWGRGFFMATEASAGYCELVLCCGFR